MRSSASLSPSEHVTAPDSFQSCYKENNPDHQNIAMDITCFKGIKKFHLWILGRRKTWPMKAAKDRKNRSPERLSMETLKMWLDTAVATCSHVRKLVLLRVLDWPSPEVSSSFSSFMIFFNCIFHRSNYSFSLIKTFPLLVNPLRFFLSFCGLYILEIQLLLKRSIYLNQVSTFTHI